MSTIVDDMFTGDLNLIDERNDMITLFGQATMQDRYLLKGETPQMMFWRVAKAYSQDGEHAKRMYQYISQFWFMPATPILSNAGTSRGLPISCYLNSVDDSLESIAATWDENVWLGARGGGIGTCWSGVRAVGREIAGRGETSGVIPFIKVIDSLTLAISQGSLRRGAAACYLDISHPEIEEFLEIRKPSGDFNRKSLNLHHGITISDAFMEAVKGNLAWDLIDPHTKKVTKTVNAREVFQAILETRIATGEPYIVFTDNVNNKRPKHHKKLGLRVQQSNLCSEIMLPTGLDHNNKTRTAVCCLGSVNIENYDKWSENPDFVKDCLLFLDNVLADFIQRTEGIHGFENARYTAMNERSVGLGVMGFHSWLQKKSIPFESLEAQLHNKRIFKKLRQDADSANLELAESLGSCQDAIDAGEKRRFSYMLAIAPTSNISVIAGEASPCIEPWNANIFTQKTLSGSFEVRNKYLEALLAEKGQNTFAVWESIIEHKGSIQHLDFLNSKEKEVFKTAIEIDQRWVIGHAGDRSNYIDQGQSINLYLPSNCDKWDLLMLHIKAWELGLKSLYYLRSQSIMRAAFAGSSTEPASGTGEEKSAIPPKKSSVEPILLDQQDYEECLSCQ